ncbi:MAG: hypothetical protein U9Q07_04330 [Planctomycetota bacterium]|nr:hypothetical protein [Planctomycetota bacterium]
MKIKFTTLMTDLDSKPIKEPTGDGETKTVTLGDMCERQLLNNMDEKDAAKRVEMFHLAMRIHGTSKEIEISVEECALLKKLIGNYNPLICGQCWDLLDKAAK